MSETATIESTLGKVTEMVEGMTNRIAKLESELNKPMYPNGLPNFSIRKGENPLSSRPYSLVSLAKALQMRASNDNRWRDHAKAEMELSDELQKAYSQSFGFNSPHVLTPLGAAFMPTNHTELADGTKVDGLPRDLVRKCEQMMVGSTSGFDLDEYGVVAKSMSAIRKDLSAVDALRGGTLVAAAAQGELIEYLRATEVMSRAGAQQIDLPPQGSVRFPRQASDVTTASTTEGTTISESTPATGALELRAKPYSGMVDIPDELLRFSSVAVEVWLRQEFLRSLALQMDADSIAGAGGQGIQGLINFSGARTVLAETVATNGNTLGPNDLNRLYADIADQNAPVDRGFFFAMTNTLFAGLLGKRADAVSAADGAGLFLFNAQQQMLSNGSTVKTINGSPVITSTQVPANRTKGNSSVLTMVIGGVGPEWLIARAGVVEIVVTNSDGDKFGRRISTMRGTIYQDAGPRHEQSFGLIDTLING